MLSFHNGINVLGFSREVIDLRPPSNTILVTRITATVARFRTRNKTGILNALYGGPRLEAGLGGAVPLLSDWQLRDRVKGNI
jgi:hypothetical protein